MGCSERILEIEKNLPELLKNNHSIGLNAFPVYYKTDYWLWIDNPKFGNRIFARSGKGYRPYLDFEPNVDLMGAYTVASFAIDFAVKQGYQKAILYGILDGEYTRHDEQILSYRHFYDQIDNTIYMMKLQQFKEIINSYKDRIQIEIPFGTI